MQIELAQTPELLGIIGPANLDHGNPNGGIIVPNPSILSNTASDTLGGKSMGNQVLLTEALVP